MANRLSCVFCVRQALTKVLIAIRESSDIVTCPSASLNIHVSSLLAVTHISVVHEVFCLFGLILIVQSTIFQSCWDGSSWVEPVLSSR